MAIRLLHDWKHRRRGEVLRMSMSREEDMVALGFAVYVRMPPRDKMVHGQNLVIKGRQSSRK